MIVGEDGQLGTLSAEDINNRLGKLTASRMADAMDFRRDGKEGADRARYKMELVAERMTDIIVPHYVTPAMQWGIDNEAAAKLAYCKQSGSTIIPASFVDHPEISYFGATPDGYLAHMGLIEFKCPTTVKYIDWLRAGTVPDEHKPQMLAQMLCTGRRWCEFVAYDPRMPEGKRLFIRSYEPAQEELDKVQEAAILFLKEVDSLFEQVMEYGQ